MRPQSNNGIGEDLFLAAVLGKVEWLNAMEHSPSGVRPAWGGASGEVGSHVGLIDLFPTWVRMTEPPSRDGTGNEATSPQHDVPLSRSG